MMRVRTTIMEATRIRRVMCYGGYKNALAWPDEKVMEKLCQLPDVVERDENNKMVLPKELGLCTDFMEILGAIVNKRPIQIVPDPPEIALSTVQEVLKEAGMLPPKKKGRPPGARNKKRKIERTSLPRPRKPMEQNHLFRVNPNAKNPQFWALMAIRELGLDLGISDALLHRFRELRGLPPIPKGEKVQNRMIEHRELYSAWYVLWFNRAIPIGKEKEAIAAEHPTMLFDGVEWKRRLPVEQGSRRYRHTKAFTARKKAEKAALKRIKEEKLKKETEVSQRNNDLGYSCDSNQDN